MTNTEGSPLTTSTLQKQGTDPASFLMNEARNTTLTLLKDDVLSHETIAREVFPFIRRAARIRNAQHSESQKADIIEKFQAAMIYYSSVTGGSAITDLDLTIDPHTTMIPRAEV
jgi:hypothetical protein